MPVVDPDYYLGITPVPLALGPINIGALDADPDTASSNAGDIYYNTVSGKFRAFNGSSWQDISTFSNAARTNVSNTFTAAPQVIKIGNDANRGLDIWRASVNQSSPLLSIFQSNGSTVLAQFDAKGALSLTSDTTGTVLLVSGTNTSATELVVKGPASNTGNLQEWQNSAGSVLAKVNSAGQLTAVIDGGSA